MKNDWLDEARAFFPDLVNYRRTIHRIAEVGMDLPQTVEYVMETLRSFGLEPELCGRSGVSCVIGNPDAGHCSEMACRG